VSPIHIKSHIATPPESFPPNGPSGEFGSVTVIHRGY
jgi:hypothetical protein